MTAFSSRHNDDDDDDDDDDNDDHKQAHTSSRTRSSSCISQPLVPRLVRLGSEQSDEAWSITW